MLPELQFLLWHRLRTTAFDQCYSQRKEYSGPCVKLYMERRSRMKAETEFLGFSEPFVFTKAA